MSRLTTAAVPDTPETLHSGIPASVTQDETRSFWFPVAHGAMIVFVSVLHLLTDEARPTVVVPLVAATVAVGVAARWIDWDDENPSGRRRRAALWCLVVALWVPLVVVDTIFLQAMFTLFPVSYVVLVWPWGLLGSAAGPMVWGTAEYANDGAVWEWLVLPTVVWLLSCVFAVWISRVIIQSEERAAVLAELAATRAELAEVERAAGVRSERERMAREIHDTLAQGFTSIVLHSRGAIASGDPEQALRTLQLVESVASEHLGEARRLVSAAADPSIGDRTLVDALARVADADEPRAGLHIDGDVAGLGGAVEVGVLRIVQEAVANARKHAAADRIDVSLARAGDQVLVDVVDDGRGFDLDADPVEVAGHTGGQGLPGLRRRVAELGGSVEIESVAGSGTSISVALPLGPHMGPR